MTKPAVVATALSVLAGLCLDAPALEVEPFRYEEGFESGKAAIAP